MLNAALRLVTAGDLITAAMSPTAPQNINGVDGVSPNTPIMPLQPTGLGISNSGNFYGAFVGNTLVTSGSAKVHFDTSLRGQ